MYSIILIIQTFNAMITAYINNKYNKHVLHLFDGIILTKDETTYLLAMKACTNLTDYKEGNQLFNKLIMINICNNLFKLKQC